MAIFRKRQFRLQASGEMNHVAAGAIKKNGAGHLPGTAVLSRPLRPICRLASEPNLQTQTIETTNIVVTAIITYRNYARRRQLVQDVVDVHLRAD